MLGTATEILGRATSAHMETQLGIATEILERATSMLQWLELGATMRLVARMVAKTVDPHGKFKFDSKLVCCSVCAKLLAELPDLLALLRKLTHASERVKRRLHAPASSNLVKLQNSRRKHITQRCASTHFQTRALRSVAQPSAQPEVFNLLAPKCSATGLQHSGDAKPWPGFGPKSSASERCQSFKSQHV